MTADRAHMLGAFRIVFLILIVDHFDIKIIVFHHIYIFNRTISTFYDSRLLWHRQSARRMIELISKAHIFLPEHERLGLSLLCNLRLIDEGFLFITSLITSLLWNFQFFRSSSTLGYKCTARTWISDHLLFIDLLSGLDWLLHGLRLIRLTRCSNCIILDGNLFARGSFTRASSYGSSSQVHLNVLLSCVILAWINLLSPGDKTTS